jgi:hypothetical protein
MPTYKFEEGKPDYIFSKPKKLPSYTDRVIFKATQSRVISDSSIIVENYDSQKVFMSDHIPLLFTSRLIL